MLLALALAVHAWILAEAWSENPLVTSLQADAKTYWTWAARIAAGEWVGAEPFHVPPLYAYVLALVQTLGGGLLSVYVLQLALHLASTALVAGIGRRLAGPAAGLVAAALFASFEDAAFFVQRVSPPTLQVFLIAWTWWEWVGLGRGASAARAVRAGLALGLAVLANPVMLPAAAVLIGWLAWRARGTPGRVSGTAPGRAKAAAPGRAHVLVTAAVLVATIAPAPAHNWLAARELIAVSTQGGLAFAIGNQPGASGTYHELEGVSVLRDRQDRDALLLARAKTGDDELGWNGADRYFYGRGFAFLVGEPAAALGLAIQKLRWYLTGRHYSDSYMPTLEMESGFAARLRAAWLRPAWLMLLAMVSAWCLRRAWCPSLPGLVFLALPLAAVLVYHYSSRYRVPALPAVAVFAAAGLLLAARPGPPARRGALALALVLGVASGWINASQRARFDDPELYRPAYEHLLGATYLSRGEPLLAGPHLQRAWELGEPSSQALLAEVLRGLGRIDDARKLAEDALSKDGSDGYAARVLARILADAGDYPRAAELFERALAREPSDVESHLGAGSCYVALGQPAQGLAHYEQGLALAPGNEDLLYLRGVALEALGREDEASAAWAPLADQAHLAGPGGQPLQARLAARAKLVELAIRRREYGRAIERLRGALAANPSDGDAAIQLSKLLASSPNDAERDGAAALDLAQGLRAVAPDNPQVLEVWALALAEGGHFDEAAAAAATAAERARALGAGDFAAEMERHAALFRSRTPYRLPAAR